MNPENENRTAENQETTTQDKLPWYLVWLPTISAVVLITIYGITNIFIGLQVAETHDKAFKNLVEASEDLFTIEVEKSGSALFGYIYQYKIAPTPELNSVFPFARNSSIAFIEDETIEASLKTKHGFFQSDDPLALASFSGVLRIPFIDQKSEKRSIELYLNSSIREFHSVKTNFELAPLIFQEADQEVLISNGIQLSSKFEIQDIEKDKIHFDFDTSLQIPFFSLSTSDDENLYSQGLSIENAGSISRREGNKRELILDLGKSKVDLGKLTIHSAIFDFEGTSMGLRHFTQTENEKVSFGAQIFADSIKGSQNQGLIPLFLNIQQFESMVEVGNLHQNQFYALIDSIDDTKPPSSPIDTDWLEQTLDLLHHSDAMFLKSKTLIVVEDLGRFYLDLNAVVSDIKKPDIK